MPSPIEKEAETAPVVQKVAEQAAATATPIHKAVEKVEKAEAVSTTVGDNVQNESKSEDKKHSRSGRVIKKTKYVLLVQLWLGVLLRISKQTELVCLLVLKVPS